MGAALLLLKTFASKLWGIIIKYPTYTIIIILCLISFHYYSANNENLEKIANLNTTIKKLNTTIEAANNSINEQNKSILDYKAKVDVLDQKLKETEQSKKDVDKTVQGKIKHDAPKESSEAFEWLHDRAGEITKWSK